MVVFVCLAGGTCSQTYRPNLSLVV